MTFFIRASFLHSKSPARAAPQAKPFRGTHADELMGIAPTGKPVTVLFIIVYQIAGEKIASFNLAIDQKDLLKQLGLAS